jgi:hypothetical protein
VGHTGRVRAGQPTGDLREHGEDLRVPAIALEPAAEVVAADGPEAQAQLGAELTDVVEGDDVGVIDTGEQPALALEPGLGRGVVVALGPEQLEGQVAGELLVLGEVELAEAGPGQLAQALEAGAGVASALLLDDGRGRGLDDLLRCAFSVDVLMLAQTVHKEHRANVMIQGSKYDHFSTYFTA